jgi:RND family efflux transporter MFP subunit
MRILRVLCCAVSILASIACGSSEGNRGRRANANVNAEPDAGPTVTITVGKSEAREVASAIQASGSLVANETSDVAPKTAGKISNVSVNVGQFVGAGAVIARIDDRDARLQLSAAQTGVKQAEALVRQAEARLGLGPGGKFNASAIPEVRTANANYEQTLAELKQAEANEARYRELIESGDVAMVTYEQFRTGRDTARARANAARQLLDVAVNNAKQSNQAIVTAQVAVEAARAEVAQAQQAITDTVIKAPFAGFVSARPVAVGEFVSSASIVATLLRTNPIKVLIQISEADVPYAGVGRGVSVEVDAYKDRKFAGTVSAVNPALDTASRSATVEALVENGDNALRAGMFATVRINKEGGARMAYVPKSAVYNDLSTQSFRVFVIQEGIAKLRVVQLGTEEGDFYQILSGVEPDETVAISNLDQLYEGVRVAY